jgi:hypothetical protein
MAAFLRLCDLPSHLCVLSRVNIEELRAKY